MVSAGKLVTRRTKQYPRLPFFQLCGDLVFLLLDLKLMLTKQPDFTNTKIGATKVQSEEGARCQCEIALAAGVCGCSQML